MNGFSPEFTISHDDVYTTFSFRSEWCRVVDPAELDMDGYKIKTAFMGERNFYIVAREQKLADELNGNQMSWRLIRIGTEPGQDLPVISAVKIDAALADKIAKTAKDTAWP